MARENALDVQELPQKLSEPTPPPADHCALSLGGDCTPLQCHWRCALDVIDELLADRRSVTGDEVDRLLDLRWQLRQRRDAEGALRLFCELRLQMEQRHYLAFFRIRRWLENHLLAAVRLCPAAASQTVPVKLDHYCAIAIRRACICAVLGRGSVLIAPRLEFSFRQTAPVEASALATSCAN